MKKFKLLTVPAIVAICLYVVVFSCQTTKNDNIMNDNRIITEFYPDGTIKLVRKDSTYIFHWDKDDNIGVSILI